MNVNTVDLTNCDKEPIHIPGRIQSHGFMLAVNVDSLIITYISENAENFITVEAKHLLGMPISEFANRVGLVDPQNQLTQLLRLGETQGSFETINPYQLKINGHPYYLILSFSGTEYLMEFEPLTLEYDIQNQIGKSVSAILGGKNLNELLDNTAKEIKDIIHYDRVMIYRFHEDGHGAVVAECKNKDLESFYGLHYPASDIPKQARELYKLNFTRIIADVNTESSSIISLDNAPVDLTNSVLRAVSPIHIQYLKNMGVQSSFSISLISRGELWGLVACHNYSPKFIDYKAREGAKLIGKIVSSALEYREEEELSAQDNNYQDAMDALTVELNKDGDMISALTDRAFTLNDIIGSTGAAILFEGNISSNGIVPDRDQLISLFKWLKNTMGDIVYYTHTLPEVFHAAREYKVVGSGIIACMISRDMEEMIVWFKPEQIATVNWAGDPNKPAVKGEDGLLNLSPRHSFEIFAEMVENTSVKWTKSEISSVIKIRERIVNAINKKAGKIRLLNDQLKRAYEELDTFSYTISHDLRTPLTSIKSYTELVIATNKSLDEQGKQLLGRVVAGADKMAFLINEILKLARVGRADVDYSKIDMVALIAEVSNEVVAALKADHVNLKFGELPSIMGAPPLIMQVFTNLISNAVKYSAASENPQVSIEGVIEGDEVIYKITDNGVGIQVDHHDKVYELFKRMNNVKDYEGTGVGLAIVKRIIDKHNARIWFESELKVGTVFYVAFKR